MSDPAIEPVVPWERVLRISDADLASYFPHALAVSLYSLIHTLVSPNAPEQARAEIKNYFEDVARALFPDPPGEELIMALSIVNRITIDGKLVFSYRGRAASEDPDGESLVIEMLYKGNPKVLIGAMMILLSQHLEGPDFRLDQWQGMPPPMQQASDEAIALAKRIGVTRAEMARVH